MKHTWISGILTLLIFSSRALSSEPPSPTEAALKRCQEALNAPDLASLKKQYAEFQALKLTCLIDALPGAHSRSDGIHKEMLRCDAKLHQTLKLANWLGGVLPAALPSKNAPSQPGPKQPPKNK